MRFVHGHFQDQESHDTNREAIRAGLSRAAATHQYKQMEALLTTHILRRSIAKLIKPKIGKIDMAQS
jgi:hypothetical protein